MKKWIYFCLVGALSLAVEPLLAQDKSQEKPKTEARAKPSLPVKVQIVFTEFDGEKKISSMPYTFMVVSDDHVGGYYSTSLRTGVRIPIETDGKDQKTTYMDIGANIDCGLPLIRQFRTSEGLILRDGQTSENIVSTDPLNGHTLHVSVTINVQK